MKPLLRQWFVRAGLKGINLVHTLGGREMFERFKRTDPAERSSAGSVATADRPHMNDGTVAADRTVDDDHTVAEDRPVAEDRTLVDDRPAVVRDRDVDVVPGPDTMRHVRARQRAEFGGFNWGAAFFGWLVALGLAALLVGLLAGAGAAVGLTQTSSAAVNNNAEEITLGGGIALLVALLIAYYCGGYVAGRMSRFDGARQGVGAWIFGLVVTIALAILAVAAGSEYNVLERLDLPRIPIDEGTLTTGGAIALVACVIGTLLAAALGGKAGERYHRRVDRVGFDT
jgi:hypothetical protein